MNESWANASARTASIGALQFSMRTLLFAFVILACLLWAVRYAIDVAQTPNNAYAMWDAGCLVIDHMRVHDGQWPNNWDELKETLAKGGGVTRNGLTIDQLKRRIAIDFEAQPAELAKAAFVDGRPEFRVVRLRGGRDIYWEGAEPNVLIYRYLMNPTELLASNKFHSQIADP